MDIVRCSAEQVGSVRMYGRAEGRKGGYAGYADRLRRGSWSWEGWPVCQCARDMPDTQAGWQVNNWQVR